MKKLTYKESWNHLFEMLTDDQRAAVLAAPSGSASGDLALAAQRLSDASLAAHGKGAGRERQLFERLLDENPLTIRLNPSNPRGENK